MGDISSILCYNRTVMKEKAVCFIGHRNAKLDESQLQTLKNVIKDLIVNKNVQIFLFGSRSDFDCICHNIVTDLKEEYPYIQRRCYTCRHETCTLESEREYWEKLYSEWRKREVHLLGVEEEVEHKTKWTSGKASYIERNQAMIDDSDICVFYYDENYKPKERKYSKRCVCTYQPNSGTRLAYKYAKQKKKQIINVFDIFKQT